MNPQDLERARNAWIYRGQQRPAFAVVPAEGQESVWDYPRPPAYVPDQRLVEVYAGEQQIARTERAIRVLETGHPPAFYLPPEAVDQARCGPARAAPSASGKVRRSTSMSKAARAGSATHSGVIRSLKARRASSPAGLPPIRVCCAALSLARACAHRPVASTAAGSPMSWSARSRASRGPGIGSARTVRGDPQRADGDRGRAWGAHPLRLRIRKPRLGLCLAG